MNIPAQSADVDRRIPVTLLTGFLGAGKTTLLNHLLRQPQMEGSAVLINEFGAVGSTTTWWRRWTRAWSCSTGLHLLQRAGRPGARAQEPLHACAAARAEGACAGC